MFSVAWIELEFWICACVYTKSSKGVWLSFQLDVASL